MYDKHKQAHTAWQRWHIPKIQKLRNRSVAKLICWWWWEENYSDKSQGIRKSQSKKFEDVQRKNMFSQFVSEHHLWQITETKITDSSIWILRDIKNFWKFPKWQGVKNLTSVGGRKLRFYISFRYLKSAWRWNLPTPFFIFKIAALTKDMNSKF